MHHRKSGRKLSRYTAHRTAMFRTMVDELMEHEVFQTTLPKAKELRRYADRVITLGKKGTLHARRRAMTLIRRGEMVTKVFGPLAERYRTRPGGYTRVLSMGPRASDSAPLAVIELVDRKQPEASPNEAKKPTAKKTVKKVTAKKKTKAA